MVPSSIIWNLKKAAIVCVLLTSILLVAQHVGAFGRTNSSFGYPAMDYLPYSDWPFSFWSPRYSSFAAVTRTRIDGSNVGKITNQIRARIGILASRAFEVFMKAYNHSYGPEELETRLYLFMNHFKTVQQGNRDYRLGRVSFSMKLNHLADRSDAELNRLNGLRELEDLGLRSPLVEDAELLSADRHLSGAPESKDWRDSPCLPGVRDQGKCGSCYAFATVDMFAMNHCLEMGPSWFYPRILRSTQQIIDCGSRKSPFSSYIFGCDGGVVQGVVAYLKMKGRLALEHSYPYEGAQNSHCQREGGFSLTKGPGYGPKYIEYHSEEEMRQHVGIHGPLVAGIHASRAFQMYKGGIFDDPSCGYNKPGNHAVLVVGYGRAQGKDYWLIKNSYGTDWGEKGYMRMVRGRGLCQMGTSGRSLTPALPDSSKTTTATTMRPKPTTSSYRGWYGYPPVTTIDWLA